MVLKWEEAPNKLWSNRLQSLFSLWEGTPYNEGSQAAKSGVDCVRFATAVLDGMQGHKTSRVWIPSDVCFHSPRDSWRAAKALASRYKPIERVRPLVTQPGDLIVVGPLLGGVGHSALVGVKPHTAWQIAGPGTRVAQTGLNTLCPKGFKVYAVYRIKDRELRWQQ